MKDIILFSDIRYTLSIAKPSKDNQSDIPRTGYANLFLYSNALENAQTNKSEN